MAIDAYSRTVTVAAPVGDAYRAVGTVGGVRGWWTPVVAGVMEPGAELVLGFEGMDEAIGLRVDELDEPARVTWRCILNTSTPEWVGSTIGFELRSAGARRSAVTLRHDGIDSSLVASGWDHFIESLAAYVELGRGRPFGDARRNHAALEVARAYAHAWMHGDFGAARALLADDLTTDVPIHTYSGADEFIAAVTGFAGMLERVEILSELSGDPDEAMLVFDMHSDAFGVLRVAEHFTVRGGLVRHIRHIHDTAVLQGLVSR